MPTLMVEAARHDIDDVSRRMRPALMAFFARRVSSQVEAEDLTQEVFIRLAQAETSLQSADAYVFQIAANLVRDKARSDRVRHNFAAAKSLEDYLGIETLDPYRVAAGRQDLARLLELIAQLPDKTRRIFTLYRIEHLDKRLIAESFGLSVRMVEIHIKTALATLAKGMELSR